MVALPSGMRNRSSKSSHNSGSSSSGGCCILWSCPVPMERREGRGWHRCIGLNVRDDTGHSAQWHDNGPQQRHCSRQHPPRTMSHPSYHYYHHEEEYRIAGRLAGTLESDEAGCRPSDAFLNALNDRNDTQQSRSRTRERENKRIASCGVAIFAWFGQLRLLVWFGSCEITYRAGHPACLRCVCTC